MNSNNENQPIDIDQLIHETKWAMKRRKEAETERPTRRFRVKENNAGQLSARSVDAPNTINDEFIEKGYY